MLIVELQYIHCQLTSESFMQFVENEHSNGKTLEKSYLAIEEFHFTKFGKKRYSGYTSFQRIWYTRIKKEREMQKSDFVQLTA